MILGTMQYMAPEQLEGKEADARTDIFAFGAVLYEMVTGRKAFEGKSQPHLIAAIISVAARSDREDAADGAARARFSREAVSGEGSRRAAADGDRSRLGAQWIAEGDAEGGAIAPLRSRATPRQDRPARARAASLLVVRRWR